MPITFNITIPWDRDFDRLPRNIDLLHIHSGKENLFRKARNLLLRAIWSAKDNRLNEEKYTKMHQEYLTEQGKKRQYLIELDRLNTTPFRDLMNSPDLVDQISARIKELDKLINDQNDHLISIKWKKDDYLKWKRG